MESADHTGTEKPRIQSQHCKKSIIPRQASTLNLTLLQARKAKDPKPTLYQSHNSSADFNFDPTVSEDTCLGMTECAVPLSEVFSARGSLRGALERWIMAEIKRESIANHHTHRGSLRICERLILSRLVWPEGIHTPSLRAQNYIPDLTIKGPSAPGT